MYDDKTYATVTSDCNLFIRSVSGNDLMVVTFPPGQKGLSFSTLAQIQANTTLDAHSVELPSTKWTDGTLFRRYSGQASVDFDFGPVSSAAALVACGTRIGPTTLPTPSEPRIVR